MSLLEVTIIFLDELCYKMMDVQDTREQACNCSGLLSRRGPEVALLALYVGSQCSFQSHTQRKDVEVFQNEAGINEE